MKKIILIINRYVTDNYGDRVIGHTMEQLFKSSDCEVVHHDFTFKKIIKNSTVSSPRIRIFSKLSSIFNAIDKIKHANCVIIGGGELISRSNSFYKYLKIWNCLIKLFNKSAKKYIFSCGVTDTFNGVSGFSKLIDSFTRVYVRDLGSRNVLVSNRCNPEHIQVIPDCVFAYNITKLHEKQDVALVGVTSISRHNKHAYYKINDEKELTNFYQNIISSVIHKYKHVIIFYNTKEDYEAATLIYNKLSGLYPNLQFANVASEFDFINRIGSSSLVISPRMHSIIVAIIQNTAVQPIIISDKLEKFQNEYITSGDIKLEDIRNKIISAVDEIKTEID